ncbi:MAG: phosphoglycerate dehydrogenase [Ruminococcaceae bacterium]|nr:phosphoglycerate dehydrogenase [Oscillospiraceae bacterium]
MKSIFLTQKKENIQKVYSTDTIAEIKKYTELDDVCYTKEDIINGGFEDTDFIFSTWGMPPMTEEEIAKYLPNVKCVFYSAGSVQSFARPFLNKGVKVFSAWAANAVPVAEYTVSQIILANKNFYPISHYMSKEEISTAKEYMNHIHGNYNAKIGIIGAGMIGKLVINMLKCFKLDILVFDPFLPDEKADELGVKKCSLEEIFSTCNVVSNHLANNENTRGMLNKALFEKMLPYSTFINTGRGAQVVEADLSDVLKDRCDLTAILDVTLPEPPQSGHPFYTLPNCFLTTHIAGSLGYEMHRMSEYMKDEMIAYINQKETKYEVTLKMLETMA